MKIGELVREYRLSKELTQQELAEKSDLSLPFINLIENNRRNLSVDTLLKILSAMDIDPSDFFRPLSETSDNNLQLLIEKIQLNKNRTEIIDLFLNILNLMKNKKIFLRINKVDKNLLFPSKPCYINKRSY